MVGILEVQLSLPQRVIINSNIFGRGVGYGDAEIEVTIIERGAPRVR